MKADEIGNNEKLKNLMKDSIDNNLDKLDYFKNIKPVDFDYSRIEAYERKRRRRNKFLQVAACLALILVISGAMAIQISKGSVHAALFEFEKAFVKLKNTLPGSNLSVETVHEDSIVKEITSQSELAEGVAFFPKLFVTENVPERFQFISLTITKYPKDVYDAMYLYMDGEEQILTIGQQVIPEQGLSVSIIGITEEIETEEGTIYISEDPFGDGGNSATYEKDNCYIDIAGKIDKKEILQIFNPE